MNSASPYLRAFIVGFIWFAAVAFKMVSRHPGHWSTYPPQNLISISVAFLVAALLLGVLATRFEKLRSWLGICIGTVVGSFAIMSLMLLLAQQSRKPAMPPQFKNTDEMMVYFAGKAAEWVKADRKIDLDYSFDSIQIIEEELARLSKDVDKTNPQKGTFGLATGYGAYVGEVLRRRDGGTWAVDDPIVGDHAYPLTLKSNSTVYPVGWCWKRLTVGEEDNVYHKALFTSERTGAITNIQEAATPK